MISLPPVVFTSDLFWCLRGICSKKKVPGYGTDLPRSRTGTQISRIRSLVAGSCSNKIDFSVFLCFCFKFSTFLLSILEVVIFIVDMVRSWQLLCTSLVIRDLKIEVWSCYCKQQTAVGVNGFTLPFYPYLGLTPILAEKLSSKLRFLK